MRNVKHRAWRGIDGHRHGDVCKHVWLCVQALIEWATHGRGLCGLTVRGVGRHVCVCEVGSGVAAAAMHIAAMPAAVMPAAAIPT